MGIFGIAALVAIAEPVLAGTISGSTRAASTGVPIAGAEVEVRAGSREFMAVSDSSGRFLLSGVPPGRYIIVSRKEGWIASRRTQRAVWIASADDQKETTLEFVTPASLGGRVVDENRAPVKGVTVTIESTHGFGVVNREVGRNGAFLFEGLEPGEYVLAVQPAKLSFGTGFVHWDAEGVTPPPNRDGRKRSWTPTYFPNVSDPTQAQRLHLTPGAVMTKYDIVLQTAESHSFEGRVLDANGDPVSASVTAWRSSADYGEHGTVADSKGRFRLKGLGEGDWMVSAQHPQGFALGAAADRLTLTGAPAKRLELRLQLPFPLDVKFDLPETIQPEQKKSLILLLEPLDLSRDLLFRETAAPSADYRRERTYGGRNRVAARSALAGVYAESVKLGDQEVLGQVTTLYQGAPPLRVVFRQARSSLTGQVDKGAGAAVIAIPDDPVRFRMAGSRIAECDANGRFQIAGIAPGPYRVLALDVIPPGAPPLFEERLAGGVIVNVKDGESANVDLKVTPWPLPLY